MVTDKKSVALIGMMGAGKSTVGGALAQRLEWSFYDTDLILEAAFQKPIPQVFRERGEPAFRSAEALLVRVLMSLEGAVLATGGGLWTSPAARALLQSFAYTVYLAAPAEVLWKRLEAQGGPGARPLLAGRDPRGTLARLLGEREAAYRLADCRVDVSSGDVESILQQVLRKLRSAGMVARHGVAA